ncbi:ABC transporter ATP-binding protein [Bacillaceae bacterium Marseille-Q3522]|nr:ABC transporter ATP-binding protein [Bacillaceae bacterium Marseille-Q3522]
MSFLKLEEIQHIFFTEKIATIALYRVSLQVEQGEFVTLLGPSGCGKSTLLSIIAGLLKPTEGAVTLNGQPIGTSPLHTGYMLQHDYLFPWKTIEENIMLGLKLCNKLTTETKSYAMSLLTEMNLAGFEQQYPSQLSGGMRQRTALVRTLATDPALLLLDEPFSALDYQTKLKLEDLVENTLRSFGKTAILVTHDIEEAIAMSDRIFLFTARPGQIYKTFIIPEKLRQLTPFATRNHPDFSAVFQKIWKEMEDIALNQRQNQVSS